MQAREGFTPFRGYKTWYQVFGDVQAGVPLLVLHGGPGYPHYHLQNLSELAKKGRPVVLYDQLGCGNSDRPDDPGLWTVKLFLEEIEAVRSDLGLAQLDLLGHSWGGALAIEYALMHPAALRRLILSSPLIDSNLWVEEADRLKNQLPPKVAATMRSHERDGTTDSEEYKLAYQQFKEQFVCRKKPYPAMWQKADDEAGLQVYNTMWGPSEAHATGNLKNWSAIDRLHEISTPTLLLSGRHDEATPAQMEIVSNSMPDVRWHVFENSSHAANYEEPEAYLGAIETFLEAK